MKRRIFVRHSTVAASATLLLGLMDVKGVDDASETTPKPKCPPTIDRVIPGEATFTQERSYSEWKGGNPQVTDIMWDGPWSAETLTAGDPQNATVAPTVSFDTQGITCNYANPLPGTPSAYGAIENVTYDPPADAGGHLKEGLAKEGPSVPAGWEQTSNKDRRGTITRSYKRNWTIPVKYFLV